MCVSSVKREGHTVFMIAKQSVWVRKCQFSSVQSSIIIFKVQFSSVQWVLFYFFDHYIQSSVQFLIELMTPVLPHVARTCVCVCARMRA